jgi:hypothetical protein
MPQEAKGTPLSVRMALGSPNSKGALEHGPRPSALDVGEAPTGEEVAGVLVADRERIAPHPVLGGELPFELRRPEIVGGGGVRGHDAGMLMGPPPAAPLDQALPGEQIADGAHGGPGGVGDLGMPRGQPVEQLARTPVRMGSPRLAQEVGEFLANAMRAVLRRMAPITQAASALLVVTGEPLVTGLATDAVAGARLRSGVQTAPIVGEEAFALVHGCRLQPGHRPTFLPRVGRAVYPECHPSSRFGVLPINPVCTQPRANARSERTGAFAGLRFTCLEGSVTSSFDHRVRRARSAPAAQAQVRWAAAA